MEQMTNGWDAMSNPYDEYDAFDPYDDEEELGRTIQRRHYEPEEGNFEYVEDSDDLIDMEDVGFEESYDFEPDPAPDPLPKTIVRKRPLQSHDAGPRGIPVRQTTPRRRGRKRRNDRGNQQGQYDPLESRYLGYEDAPPRPAVPRDEPQPRPARQPRQRRRGHGCLVTLVIAILLAVVAYWAVAHPVDDRLAFSREEQQSVNGTLSWSVPGMPYYLLALGSDAQEGTTGARSDTMILIRIDLLGGKVTMLSIPRDTMIELEGYGRQKINAAYAFGGPGGSVKAVSELCGVGIQHVAVVHIDELAGLVDYLGGVTVNVPEAAYDPEHTGADLAAGTQTLDGATAVAWARTRYGYLRGDFQRQEDQRILMEAIINRMLSLSPREMPGALEHVGELIGTDLRCYDLVPLFLRFKLAKPTIYSTSVPSTTETIDGVSYVIADEPALAEMMRVINAGGDPGAPVN